MHGVILPNRNEVPSKPVHRQAKLVLPAGCIGLRRFGKFYVLQEALDEHIEGGSR